MRFDTRVRPVVGLRATLGRLAATTPPRQPDRLRLTVSPPSGAAGVVMIDGWVAHRIALTVAKLPGPPIGKAER